MGDDVWLERSIVADEGNSVGDHLRTDLSTSGTNACVDQTGWDVDFASRCYSCGFRTMGNAYRSGRCMAARQHISYECGACIGNHIHCGLNCKPECRLGRCTTHPACWECQVEKCQPAFFECAGVYPPRPSTAAVATADGSASGGACVHESGWDVDFNARCYTC